VAAQLRSEKIKERKGKENKYTEINNKAESPSRTRLEFLISSPAGQDVRVT